MVLGSLLGKRTIQHTLVLGFRERRSFPWTLVLYKFLPLLISSVSLDQPMISHCVFFSFKNSDSNSMFRYRKRVVEQMRATNTNSLMHLFKAPFRNNVLSKVQIQPTLQLFWCLIFIASIFSNLCKNGKTG